MDRREPDDAPNVSPDDADAVSTGSLPPPPRVAELVAEAHRRFAGVTEGANASYYPALADASPSLFGICVAGVDGAVHSAGDAQVPFTIMSISKVFVFALLCDALGAARTRDLLGVNATGLPFNSVLAVELAADRRTNPMVNSGAIAATSFVPGADAAARWAFIRDGLSRFAGRTLEVDEEVYASASASNQRNRGMALLLESYGRLGCDPAEATDLYTRQCCLLATAEDLAAMAATLADGGVCPRTGRRAVSADACRRTLAVMATAGLYEASGDWLYDVGLPGKSGVSGGIVCVAPGKGGMGCFSPPLDDQGNSVRGGLVARFLAGKLGLDVFASRPAVPSVD